MERHRLKTVMILILALLNGFLLIHLVRLRVTEAASNRRGETQLAALFAADGVELSAGVLNRRTAPRGYALGPPPEDALASFFLPDGSVQTEEDGGRTYAGEDGTLRCTDGGTFSAEGSWTAALCRRFCRQFGFQTPDLPPAPDGTWTVSAYYGGLEVTGCETSFAFTDGELLSVSGMALSRNALPVRREEAPLNAAAALAVFQARLDRSAGVSVVTEIKPRYLLSQGETAELEPAWRVATDAGEWTVNAVDGTLIPPNDGG